MMLVEEAFLCLSYYLAKVSADDDNDVDFQLIILTKVLVIRMIIEIEIIMTRLLVICYHNADYVLVRRL